jgi:hypothetical protein
MPGIDPAILAQIGNTQAYPGSPKSPVTRTPDAGGGDESQSLQQSCESACAMLQECAATMDELQGAAEMSEEPIDPATEQAIAEAATKVAEANDAMTTVLAALSGSGGPPAAPPKGPPPANVPPPA